VSFSLFGPEAEVKRLHATPWRSPPKNLREIFQLVAYENLSRSPRRRQLGRWLADYSQCPSG